MPHITIEYSANLEGPIDIDDLVDRVHRAALSTGLPPLDGLRTRAARRDHVRIADGDPSHGFLALVARIGPGRSSEAKTSLLETVIAELDRAVEDLAGRHAVAISAEIQEIDAAFRINHNGVRAHLHHRPTPLEEDT